MSKTQELAAAFLQKAQSSKAVPVRNSINAFNSLFDIQELNDQENRAIEKILVDGFEPGAVAENAVDFDAAEIKRLTKELKAIKKQELILIGERIAQARDVFKKYKNRSFREWMELTFGSFKTGYNYLAFYDFYAAVPDDLKPRLKEMPAKAVYVLASRKAPLDVKIGIVRDHAQATAHDLILLIKDTLSSGAPARLPTQDKIISALEKAASLLLPNRLDPMQRKRLSSFVNHLKEIIEFSNKI